MLLCDCGIYPPVPLLLRLPVPPLLVSESVPQYTVPLVYAFRSHEADVALAMVRYVTLAVPFT